MPIITAVRSQKNQKRVNIYLDNKFGFGIDLDNLATLKLGVETELTEKEVEEIVEKAEFQKTLDKLLKFATLRPRSAKEIKDWFKRKKVHESLHLDLFNRLKRLDLVDDEKFTRWWIEQRQSFRPKAIRVLRLELRQKGIAKDIVDKVLEETKIDEEKTARQLIEKKAYRWKNLSKKEARQKIYGYLLRKGFSWEVVRRVLLLTGTCTNLDNQGKGNDD